MKDIPSNFNFDVIKIIGADIVEFNPQNDINSMTTTVSAKLLKEILAKMLS